MADHRAPTAADVAGDFEAWARASARLRGKNEAAQRALLMRWGVAGCWAQVDVQWRHCLVEDIAAGNMERVFRYSELCAKHAAEADDTEHPEAETPPPPAFVATEQAPPANPDAPYPKDTAPVVTSGNGQTLLQRDTTGPEWPAGDFRREIVDGSDDGAEPVVEEEEGPTLVAWSRSAVSGKVRSYVERLDGEGAPPEPSPYQSHTDLPLVPAMQSDLEAAETIAKWPVESYAAFCAKLANYPERSEQLCAEVGLRSDQALVHVRRAWAKRFKAEPELQTRWQQLVIRFQQPAR